MTTSATDPTARTDWAVVIAATMAGYAAALQFGKAAAALPLIRAEFGTDLQVLAWFVGLLPIIAAAVGIFLGDVTRRLGARRAGLWGLGLLAIGAVGTAEAGGIMSLMIARLVEALGYVLTITAMPAIIQPATRNRDRMLALGLWATWLPGGIAVILALSYFTMDTVGWRGVFRLSAILATLSLLALWGVTQTQVRARALSAPAPLIHIFRRDPIVIVLAFCMFSAGNSVMLAFLPTLLVDEVNMVPTSGVAVAFVGALGFMVGNVGGAAIMHRGTTFRVLLAWAFAGMILFGGLTLLNVGTLETRIVASVLYAAAAGLIPSVVWGSVPAMAKEPGELPVLSGLFFQGAGIGQSFGPVIVGIAVTATGQWAASFWVLGGMSLIGFLISLGLSPIRHEHEP